MARILRAIFALQDVSPNLVKICYYFKTERIFTLLIFLFSHKMRPEMLDMFPEMKYLLLCTETGKVSRAFGLENDIKL